MDELIEDVLQQIRRHVADARVDWERNHRHMEDQRILRTASSQRTGAASGDLGGTAALVQP